MRSPLDVALDWAGKGKPVFPCDPKTKRPRTARGFKDATTDEAAIDAWWGRHPDSMVGIPTGHASGLVVLDFDIDHEKGIDSTPHMRAMIDSGEIPEATFQVKTPRGGVHFYLQAPGVKVSSAAGFGGVRGFDIRGDGGYIIAAGSVRSDGCEYLLESLATSIAAMPTPLLDRLTARFVPSSQLPQAGARKGKEQGAILEGARNDEIFRVACKLKRAGVLGETLVGALRGVNDARCVPPLPVEEVRDIAERVSERTDAVEVVDGIDVEAGVVPPSWEPIAIGDLDPGDAGEPVWDRLLTKGTATLLSAREKTGKTTLLGMLLRETARSEGGELLGIPVHPVRTLVVSEEGPLLWSVRRDDDHLPDDLLVISRPRDCPNTLLEWDEFCKHLALLIEREGVGLVMIDTWSHFVPVDSENDNAQVARAARSLGRLCSAGAAVLVVHHMSKQGGSRGGTALPAAVDTTLEMKRPATRGLTGAEDADDGDDGTRIFDFAGRGDPPPRIVARWDGATYQVENAKSMKHLKVERTKQVIIDTLVRIGGGRIGEVVAAWPEGGMKMPSERTRMRYLRDLEAECRIEVMSGDGGANDPRVYRATTANSGIPA